MNKDGNVSISFLSDLSTHPADGDVLLVGIVLVQVVVADADAEPAGGLAVAAVAGRQDHGLVDKKIQHQWIELTFFYCVNENYGFRKTKNSS